LTSSDTGSYADDAQIEIAAADEGSGAGWVTFQGSTNEAAGGTVLSRSGSSSDYQFYLTGAYVKLRNLTLSNLSATWTVRAENGPSRLEYLTLTNCQYGVIRYGNTGPDGDLVSENCLFANMTYGSYCDWSDGNGVFLNCTFYGNKYATYGGSYRITNCVIYADAGLQSGAYAYFNATTSLRADYNLIFVTNGAKVAKAGSDYATLSDWQGYNSQDLNSLDSDPLFADPAAGEYHLKSTTGWYSNGVWTAASEHSPGIDAGVPGWDYSNEKDPDGGRVNLGRYGNTDQASKTVSGYSIECQTFNTHGRATDAQSLNWNASGGWTGTETIYIDVSPDNGATWSSVTTGVTVTDYSISWDTTGWSPSIIARWRIGGESGEAADTNDSIFTIGTGNYYINDDFASGDVYSSGVGNDSTGDGRTNSPFRTLAAVLANRDLEPGDTVYMDTGTYTNTVVEITSSDQGSSSDWLTIQGSTNEAAGGTLLTHESTPTEVMLYIYGPYIRLRHLRMRNDSPTYAIRDEAGKCRGEFLTVTNTQYALLCYSGAIGDTVYENCLFAGVERVGYAAWGPDIAYVNCTFYGNKYVTYGNDFQVTNCVIHVDGATKYAYYDTGTGLKADYNLIFVTNGAQVARASSTDYATLADWQGYNSQDANSLDADPLFADPAGFDFHLKSKGGRYDGGTWVPDIVHSPAIDAGYTNSPHGEEPAPNGDRINIGRFGNTPEASKSPIYGAIVIVR